MTAPTTYRQNWMWSQTAPKKKKRKKHHSTEAGTGKEARAVDHTQVEGDRYFTHHHPWTPRGVKSLSGTVARSSAPLGRGTSHLRPAGRDEDANAAAAAVAGSPAADRGLRARVQTRRHRARHIWRTQAVQNHVSLYTQGRTRISLSRDL